MTKIAIVHYSLVGKGLLREAMFGDVVMSYSGCF